MTPDMPYVPETGDRVRIRRYEVPCPEMAGGPPRTLLLDVTGTIASVRKLSTGRLITLEGDGTPIYTGYQFAGRDAESGLSWSLQTEITQDPE